MPLTDEQITEHLKNFTGWARDAESVAKTYRFSGFMKAMEFVNRVAIAAARHERYPQICIEGNTVTFRVGDEDGIADQDFRLVREIEPLALEFI